MTTTLVPRMFGDLFDWFEMERPKMTGHMIRVEDSLTDQEYHVRAELPGMDPAKDISISVEDGTLTIHAEREEREEAKGRSEFRYGVLERSVRLPGNADRDSIKATYDKGILDVSVPLRKQETVGRSISIEAR
ncbi:Hsp20/alpha crystallin family protein [Luedemannella flava]|uniref:Hsp20/alpha crystallin family protein n=1 Tax=Luedemannella flava TaxID=349316 RepID=A0ABP4Y5Y1_9ACTN